MPTLTSAETLDDILYEYQTLIDSDDANWIDDQRLRIIRALEFEAEQRAVVFKQLADSLLKGLDNETQLKVVK